MRRILKRWRRPAGSEARSEAECRRVRIDARHSNGTPLRCVPYYQRAACLLATVITTCAHSQSLSGYLRNVSDETAAARAARHDKVAARRAGPIVICHRGAGAIAPENTLEAYTAAMDFGADGCEVDVRRTADGILVLFHDDMLDRLTGGFGTVNQLSYYELLSLKPRFVYGTANPQTRAPTFAALLTLARQRAMLLHLDVKSPGSFGEPDLDNDIAAMLDAAEAWDHVVAVNTANAPKLARHPKIKLLRYKAPGLFEGRKDVDPDAVKVALEKPGEMIIVDDPRVAARELNRPPYQPVALPRGLRESCQSTSGAPNPLTFIPFFHLAELEQSAPVTAERLIGLLRCDPKERMQPDGDTMYERQRTARIVERAWAAQKLGEMKVKSNPVVELLEHEVKFRSLHRDWMYHGLDGALAARALGMIGATESVPVLVDAFMRIDPALEKVVDPRFKANPLAWTDFRTKMYIIPALGELRCEASKAFLQEYLTMDEAKAREVAPVLREEATRALLKQNLTASQFKLLLQSPHSSVRGTAILEMLDHPAGARTAALNAVAPWVLSLPRAR